MEKMKIGITGGIGTGKSYCARIFQSLGIPVYIADIRAAILINTKPEIIRELTLLLGDEIYTPEGYLNKKLMAKALFDDPGMREEVNKHVHPAVGKDYENWHNLQTSNYTLKESALLIESQSYKSLDRIIVVKAPEPLRIQRVMHRDRITEAGVYQRIRVQMNEEKKEAFADFIIDNGGTIPLLPQVLEIHKKVVKYNHTDT